MLKHSKRQQKSGYGPIYPLDPEEVNGEGGGGGEEGDQACCGHLEQVDHLTTDSPPPTPCMGVEDPTSMYVDDTSSVVKS